MGTLNVNLPVASGGIVSGEVFGSLAVFAGLGVPGIPSGQSFGATKLVQQQFARPTGIPSAEAHGSALLQLGYPQSLEAVGIASLEYVSDLLKVANRHSLVFRPPSVQETPAGRNVLHVRYGVHRGISVIQRSDGSIYQTRYPALTDLEQALKYWMGGYRHVISLDEAEELTAAGYGSNITLEEV
ncbi:hypothetical protein AB0C33_01870 [Nonomuraea sp. NPDC048881]|uniref:hypothetical protein n=1 Tax=Nonomuraea sp. NPDC048881 TaxID=3155030 RepID=UPI0033FFA7B5